MRVEATSVRARTAPGRSAALVARWVLVSLALLAVLVALVGLAFAGSTARIADGVEIAGVDVGGLTPKAARRLLEQRFDRVAHVPVVFTAGGERYPIKATSLSVEADWASAIETAAREGEGFGPVRGFRRLQARFFGAEIAPPVQAYGAALDFKVAGLAEAIDQRHVEAKLVRRGLGVEVVPGQPGRRLDQEVAGGRIVRALARLDAGSRWRCRFASIRSRSRPPTWLRPHVRPASALSAPVRLQIRRHALEAAPLADRGAPVAAGRRRDSGHDRRAWRGSLVHEAPQDGGARARRRRLRGQAGRHRHRSRQARPRHRRAGDREGAARGGNLADGADRRALRPHDRAERTTADAEAMGITGVVGSYYTTYGGIPSRLHNVALVAQLIDGALIGPGETFSFNGTTGERTAEKGFQEAPVIINGELQTGLGGGICQVSTTVFNAAYEAGSRSTSASTTRSTSRTTRSGATRPSTTPIRTSSSRTTPTSGCCCARSSARAR